MHSFGEFNCKCFHEWYFKPWQNHLPNLCVHGYRRMRTIEHTHVYRGFCSFAHFHSIITVAEMTLNMRFASVKSFTLRTSWANSSMVWIFVYISPWLFVSDNLPQMQFSEFLRISILKLQAYTCLYRFISALLRVL